MKRIVVGCSLVLISASFAVAHPGHGTETMSGHSAWHYVSSPSHALSIGAAMVVALVAGALAFRVLKLAR